MVLADRDGDADAAGLVSHSVFRWLNPAPPVSLTSSITRFCFCPLLLLLTCRGTYILADGDADADGWVSPSPFRSLNPAPPAFIDHSIFDRIDFHNSDGVGELDADG